MDLTGRILLTGATGHVGSRLLHALEADGREVRCLTRSPGRLRAADVVEGDVLDRESLLRAFDDVDAAYYLVHSLGSGRAFADEERRAAETFAEAAVDAGLSRIVYLGGLAHGWNLSEHLASRREVGRILRESDVPTVEFRASVVIGAGSASFELVRTLVESLPVVALPSWASARTQPIALEDAVEYLVAALDLPLPESRVYEIGGADVITYRELVEEVAAALALQTVILSLPTPDFAGSRMFERLAPERARVWLRLIEGLRHDSAVRNDAALRDFAVEPMALRDAIRVAAGEARQAA